jgi:hypothetical protein
MIEEFKYGGPDEDLSRNHRDGTLNGPSKRKERKDFLSLDRMESLPKDEEASDAWQKEK